MDENLSLRIFSHARVITCNATDDVIPDGFVAVKGDRILHIGDMVKLSSFPALAEVKQINLFDKTIIPGIGQRPYPFHDAPEIGVIDLAPGSGHPVVSSGSDMPQLPARRSDRCSGHGA